MLSLKQWLDPRFLVLLMMGIGGLSILFILIAASQNPTRDVANATTKIARSVTGYVETFPPRPIPPYALSGPNGQTSIPQLRGRIAVVIFGRQGCQGCVDTAASLNGLAKAINDPGLSIAAVSLFQDRAELDDIFLLKSDKIFSLNDRVGAFDAYIPISGNTVVSIIYDLKGNRELGRINGFVDWTLPSATVFVSALLLKTG